MSHELTVKLLSGIAFTIDVTNIETVQQLKWVLREKFCDDPVEQKILHISVLQNLTPLADESGLQGDEVTIIYGRNEVEAATRHDLPTGLEENALFKLNVEPRDGIIEEDAFSGCTELVIVTISDTVSYIGKRAFEDCKSLERVIIPNSVTSIEYGAFLRCDSLDTINLPPSVTAIADYAFAWCSSLKRITIPDGVTRIADHTFQHCPSLESIRVPDSVTDIGFFAFRGCTSLKSITINSLIELGDMSFCGCSELQAFECTGSASISEVGHFAFEDCISLRLITIPTSVTEIGHSSFKGCKSLRSITVPGVTTICKFAFSGCTSLESIVLGDSLTTIEDCAFQGCVSLQSIRIPASVLMIGQHTFKGCSGLEHVAMPNHLSTLFETFETLFEGCTSLAAIVFEGWSGSLWAEPIWNSLWRLHFFGSNCIRRLIRVSLSGAHLKLSLKVALLWQQLYSKVDQGLFERSPFETLFEGCTSLAAIVFEGWSGSLWAKPIWNSLWRLHFFGSNCIRRLIRVFLSGAHLKLSLKVALLWQQLVYSKVDQCLFERSPKKSQKRVFGFVSGGSPNKNIFIYIYIYLYIYLYLYIYI